MKINTSTRIASFLELSRTHPIKEFKFKKIIWLKPQSSMYLRSKKK